MVKGIITGLAGGSAIIGAILLLILIIGIGPALLIGGLNLMGLAVPFTLKTWFGAFLVMLVLRGGS